MKRPTIPDLAEAAGVSVSTVNRVINQGDTVRQVTRERVLHTAQEIGFYGLGSITHSVNQSREKHRFGVLLLNSSRRFYRNLGDSIVRATERFAASRIEVELAFLDDLAPDKVAGRIADLESRNDALSLVVPQHPLVADAIDVAIQNGVPVIALIGPLSAHGNVSFVGLDNWKVGRTSAWAFHKLVRNPGKIGILIGNHRFRNQEMNESGFRSYFREHNEAFNMLEPLSTYESAAVAREHVERLLTDHPDLCGLYISGGGITGAIDGLRAMPRRDDFVAVGYELFDETRAALIDGTLNMVISHPIDEFAYETIATMIKAKKILPESGAHRVALNFDIYTSENV